MEASGVEEGWLLVVRHSGRGVLTPAVDLGQRCGGMGVTAWWRPDLGSSLRNDGKAWPTGGVARRSTDYGTGVPLWTPKNYSKQGLLCA